MKGLLLLIFGLLFLNEGISQVQVKGYYRKDGTYVQSHYRSSPDGNPYNNWSYPGNVNPYTGRVATGDPSTYLANYYKTYSNGYSDKKLENYTSILCYTNYRGLVIGDSYTLTDNYGTKTGYINYYRDKLYKVYDADLNHIGYVETNRNGNRFSVYDLYGYQVTSNRHKTGAGEIILSISLIALTVVLAAY